MKPHEAIQPTDEPRECGATDSFAARLESERKLDAAMAAARAVVEAHEATPRPAARVFLIPSAPVEKIRIAVLGLALHGYTMKHHGWVVEMVRSYE